MEKPLILVMGATGKTGAPVVQQLRERGFPVRAFVHRIDERSAALQSAGAEIVEGDFQDLASVRKAMAGVRRLYLCHPPALGLLSASVTVATAAREVGVEVLVNMSQITSRADARSPLSRAHYLAEQALDWADVGAVHVRPGFFAEDLYLFTAGSIPGEGVIRLPFGNGKHAPVSAKDIASVVVAILSSPADHAGQRYVLTGAKDQSLNEMAEVFSKEIGREVTYVDIPVDVWKRALIDQAGMQPYLATHLAAVAIDHQEGYFSAETDAVATLTGRPPETLDEFVRRHADVFGLPAK